MVGLEEERLPGEARMPVDSALWDAVQSDPTSQDALLVLADWLTARGDPWGELLARQVAGVPIPAALWLFGSGLAGLIGLARRRHNR